MTNNGDKHTMAKSEAITLGFYRPHPRVTLDCGDVMMTKQSHKDECDIHNILRQYQRTGIINHINTNQPLYSDLPSNIDYQSSMNLLLEAQEAFASLPSKVREHFSNDPGRFLAAFNDPSQAETLRGFGLLKPKPPESQAATAGAAPTGTTSATARPDGVP